jgi:hypothetical protein
VDGALERGGVARRDAVRRRAVARGADARRGGDARQMRRWRGGAVCCVAERCAARAMEARTALQEVMLQ